MFWKGRMAMHRRTLMVTLTLVLGVGAPATAQEPGGYFQTDMAAENRRQAAQRNSSPPVRSSPGPVRQASPYEEIVTNIHWAMEQGYCASWVRICMTWVQVVFVDGIPVPVTRHTTTAREMILRAKAARVAGLDDLAFVMVFSTQLHNPDVLHLYNQHPDLVLRVLDTINVGRDFNSRDYAWAYLRSVLGI